MMKKFLSTILACTTAVAFVGCASQNDAGENPLRGEMLQLKPFSYADVTLDKNSEFAALLEKYTAYYLALNVDDLMFDLRLKNGLDTKGATSVCTESNNWYADGKTMHGYWLWAYSRLYNYTGDEAIKEKANYFADSLYEVFAKNPLSFCSTVDYYSFEKYLNGILENYRYCGNENSLQFAKELVEHANANFSRERLFGNNSDEWYTAVESIYKYIELSGDTSALSFATEFEYPEFWDIFATGRNVLDYTPSAGMHSTHFHAFSHINSLSGAAMAYKMKEQYYYFEALEKAWDWLRDTQMMVTGGIGPSFEHLLSEDEIVAALTGTQGDSCETQCTSYAIGKMNDYLMQFSGCAKYGDWNERLLWNIVMASIDVVDGHIMYYADYETTGGEKRNREIQWTCCCGSCLVNMTNALGAIYYHDTDNIYVNQFVSSSVAMQRKRNKVTLTQETQFPYSNAVLLTLDMERSASFAVKVRKPEWANGTVNVTINGVPQTSVVDDFGWIVLQNQWQDGDTIELSFPMEIIKSGFVSTTGVGTGIYALSYGPIALVAKTADGVGAPKGLLDYQTATQALMRKNNASLTFTVAETDQVTFTPYYLEELGQTYYMYIEY